MRPTRYVLLVLTTLALSSAVGLPAVASAAGGVSVAAGSSPDSSAMPNNRFTVADNRQLTGRRVALPMPSCTAATSSTCDTVRLLNTLDGFDLQPRVTIPFTGGIDVSTVVPSTVYVEGGGLHVGLQEITYDPAQHVLLGTLRDQLPEQSTVTLVVTTGVRDTSGRPLTHGTRVPFTTMSATTELDRLRRSLDDGTAYRQAGITSRAASFTQGSTSTVFPVADQPFINRLDQTTTDPTKLTSSAVLTDQVAGSSCFAFGSFESPQFVTADAYVPPVPTSQTPPALGKARVGFSLVVPAGVAPAGGWPVAVYGPGFTRSYFDLFLTSDANAAAGIATLSIDPLGHGYGPASKISVGAPGTEKTFLAYGRGRDLDGDGKITTSEGVQPSDRKMFSGGTLVSDTPSPYALVGDRDGLTQTALDNMAAVRMVENGVTVPGCLGRDVPLRRTGVSYYGLSFGSIYGTVLMGTDPHVHRALLNVGGGPIVDIARQGFFRFLLAPQLGVNRPNLLNGGPGLDGFTEDIPQPFEPPITTPHAGAVRLQRYLRDAIWYERPGSPESFAPLLRLRPRYAAKDVLFQTAYADDTVPNIEGGNMYRAGKLFDRVTYYRNDKTPTNGADPHGFLEDPTLFGRQMAEVQLTTFLRDGTAIDPDGPGPVFEFPIANPDNLNCLHFGQPSEGMSAFPPAPAGECGPRPADKEFTATSTPSGAVTPSGNSDAVASTADISGAVASTSGFSGSGSAGAVGPASGSLAVTGLGTALPLLALLSLGLAAVLRRHRVS